HAQWWRTLTSSQHSAYYVPTRINTQGHLHCPTGQDSLTPETPLPNHGAVLHRQAAPSRETTSGDLGDKNLDRSPIQIPYPTYRCLTSTRRGSTALFTL